MQKKMVLLCAALAGLWIGSGSAPVEATSAAWQCSYQGSHSRKNQSTTFRWQARWHRKGSGWRLLGSYRDSHGAGFLDGQCSADGFCSFTQFYKSGTLFGKKYYWAGYFSRQFTQGRQESRFKGTWGYSAVNRSGGGKWSATALCRR